VVVNLWDRIRQIRFAVDPARAVPTATEDLRGAMFLIDGAADADQLYLGIENASGDPEMVKVSLIVGATSPYTVSNRTPDRTYDCNATTVDELADVLGSLIVDLQSRGLIT
jgi:hypothetical protein